MATSAKEIGFDGSIGGNVHPTVAFSPGFISLTDCTPCPVLRSTKRVSKSFAPSIVAPFARITLPRPQVNSTSSSGKGPSFEIVNGVEKGALGSSGCDCETDACGINET